MTYVRFGIRLIRHVWRGIQRAAGLVLFLLLIQRSTFPTHLQWNAVSIMVSDLQFDYVAWEVAALATKAQQALWGAAPYMNEADRSQYVREYMADLTHARQLEAQVNGIYTDPQVADPQAASAVLRAERDALRDDLERRQPLMEAILEGQVATVLVDEGFGMLGQLIPPMSMHFTQVPLLLIVSPRDQIRFDVSINLDPMTVDAITELEARIDREQNVSSLIVPLGGIALYPAMILETDNVHWAIETFAHEWLHHYLFMYPLGLAYDFAGEARIINETTADLFGKAITPLVLARYYPELLAQSGTALVTYAAPTPQAAFNFGSEMHQTRFKVDLYMARIAMLERKRATSENLALQAVAWGSAEAAYAAHKAALILQMEAFMEQRRTRFYENGFNIRKLNQAYFAFYGGYQGGIAGIGGQDPIGPAVAELQAMSPSLHDWIITMRGITTREELVRVRDSRRAAVGG